VKTEKKKVLLLAETGFIIRNLILGYFAEEITKNYSLVVAVHRPNDSALQELISNKDIEFIPFPMTSYKERRSLWQKVISWDNLMYGVQSARKPNASLAIQTKLFEGKSSLEKKVLQYSAISFGKIIQWSLLNDWFDRLYLERFILKKQATSEWIGLLKEVRPVIVFSTMLTHSIRFRCSSDLPVVAAAYKMGIRTCTLVQSWDNLSSKTSFLPSWIDRYFTWSNSMTDELIMLNAGVCPDKVKVVGSPQYDFHLNADILENRLAFLKRVGLKDTPYVVIGTGTARWMPDEMQKMVSLSRRILKECPGMQVLIRLHPKDDGSRWANFEEELKRLGVVIYCSAPEVHMDLGGFSPSIDFYRDQVNTIFHSSVIINSSSSLTVDAAILNKPVICIAYDLGKDELFQEGRSLAYSKSVHYLAIVQTKGVWLATSEDECMLAVKSYHNDPSLNEPERKMIVNLVADRVDLIAGKRLANAVAQILS